MRLPCVLKIFGIITRTQLIASAIQFGVVRMQASNFSERMMDESGKKMLQLSSANNETQNNQSVASCIGENNNVFGAASNEIESQANKPHIVACLNGFKTSFYVASAFYGFIIGTRGAVKTRIEKETDTTFQIPRAGSGNIEIFGKIQENVCMARQQIESIVSSSREKLRVNHFNGVRIYNEDIKSNYERWMQEILQGPPIDGLTESMFTHPVKLHITINVMTLLDDQDVARATQLLNDCVEKVIVPAKKKFGKIELKVPGVGIFSDRNPSKVNVLLGRIESDSLQQIANEILDYFVAEGFSKHEHNRTTVKMHMTLINTSHDKGQTENDGHENATPRHRRWAHKTFDATALLEKYADYDFGSQEVKEILLSKMSEKNDDGFYKTIASVNF